MTKVNGALERQRMGTKERTRQPWPVCCWGLQWPSDSGRQVRGQLQRIGMMWAAGRLQVDCIMSLLHQAKYAGLSLSGRGTFCGSTAVKKTSRIYSKPHWAWFKTGLKQVVYYFGD